MTYQFFRQDIQNRWDQDYHQEEYKNHCQDKDKADNRRQFLSMGDHRIHARNARSYYQRCCADRYIDLKNEKKKKLRIRKKKKEILLKFYVPVSASQMSA